MSNEQRTKVWVDSFQTKLTLRIVGYLVVFLLVLTNFLFGWRLWQEELPRQSRGKSTSLAGCYAITCRCGSVCWLCCR